MGYFTFSEIYANQISQMEQNAVNRVPLTGVRTIYSAPLTKTQEAKKVNVFAIAILIIGIILTGGGIVTLLFWA